MSKQLQTSCVVSPHHRSQEQRSERPGLSTPTVVNMYDGKPAIESTNIPKFAVGI